MCQVDALGWGDTLVFKGEPAESPDKNMSLSRRKNQALNYINIQDNKIDFIQSSPTPTNSKGETNDLFPPEPIDDLSVDCQEGRAVLRWTARSDRDTPQDLLRYEISYFKENSLDGVTHQHSVSSEGEQEEFIIDNLNYDTDYRFMIEVLDRINRLSLIHILIVSKREAIENLLSKSDRGRIVLVEIPIDDVIAHIGIAYPTIDRSECDVWYGKIMDSVIIK